MWVWVNKWVLDGWWESASARASLSLDLSLDLSFNLPPACL